MAITPATNPSLGNSPVTTPSDEQTEYPTVAPPAIVDPETYLTETGNAQIVAGVPRVVYEEAGYERGGHLWFVALKSYGYSGKLVAWIALSDDNRENFRDTTVKLLSDDHGVTFPRVQHEDLTHQGFHNGPCLPRYYDAETGRIYEFSMTLKPNPPGQHETYTTPYTYYANGGSKRVVKSNGSSWGVMPDPMREYLPTFHPDNVPRNAWDDVWGEGQIIKLQDGTWFTVLDGRFDGGGEWWTGLGMKSAPGNKGQTWTYSGIVPALNSALSENALFLGPTGKVICLYRDLNTTGGSPLKVTISTDATATAWTTPVDIWPGAVLGTRIGNAAPTGVTLDDGTHVCLAGRTGNYALNLAVCTDGGESPTSTWSWWSLSDHHNTHANGGGTSLDNEDDSPGLIHKLFTASSNHTSMSEISSCYSDIVKIAPQEVLIIYDWTPQRREQIGTVHTFLPNVVYVIHLRITRT